MHGCGRNKINPKWSVSERSCECAFSPAVRGSHRYYAFVRVFANIWCNLEGAHISFDMEVSFVQDGSLLYFLFHVTIRGELIPPPTTRFSPVCESGDSAWSHCGPRGCAGDWKDISLVLGSVITDSRAGTLTLSGDLSGPWHCCREKPLSFPSIISTWRRSILASLWRKLGPHCCFPRASVGDLRSSWRSLSGTDQQQQGLETGSA